jgi:tagatose 6-phosphate kinase
VILTVTLNLALDVTYLLPGAPALGEVNRVSRVAARAGGKGVNVARVLGGETVVMGFAGGRTGDAVRAELRAAELVDETVMIVGETRRTVVVHAPGAEPTGFWEPGPEITAAEWFALVDRFRELAATASAVVLAGSLPAGVPEDAYAVLAGAAPCPVVVDAEGEPLRRALAARPAVVAPNRAELATLAPGVEPLVGAGVLRDLGAESVVVSMGAEGLLAVTPEGAWRAAPPERVSGNPTGAGDAATAALVAGLVEGAPWPDRLADAVALSAAAVHGELAGDVDRAAYARYREVVKAVPAGPPADPSRPPADPSRRPADPEGPPGPAGPSAP